MSAEAVVAWVLALIVAGAAGAVIGKVKAERRRLRRVRSLAEAFGFPAEAGPEPSALALAQHRDSRRFALEGMRGGHLVRVSGEVSGEVELRIGLTDALPGGLRIVPGGSTVPAAKVLRDPELAPGMTLLSESPEASKALLETREVRQAVARFFKQHPDAKLLGGEIVMIGATGGSAENLVREADRAIWLAEVLARATIGSPSLVVSGPARAVPGEALAAAGAGVLEVLAASAPMGARTLKSASAPDALGPVSPAELDLRETYARTRGRAMLLGGTPMAAGMLMVITTRHLPGLTLMFAGVALTAVGATLYGLLLRCPSCGRPQRIWRYLDPSECHACGLRLR